MRWPEVTELNDVIITPVNPGSNKATIEFAASHGAEFLGHYRYGLPESVVEISSLKPSEAKRAKVIEEPIIYGGLLFNHFGHALTESIHRLWPKYALKILNPAKVAFSLVRDAKVRPYMTEALNLHGISKHEVLRIEVPLCFRRLFVGPQARQMAGPTIVPDYQTMLDRSLERRIPKSERERRLYISRLHYHRSGSFYGESYVASQLASAGFEIIYPERHTLTELVTMLRQSKVAIFAEGSAIHALELCGSVTPEVLIIARRWYADERFAPLLSNICRKWKISNRWLFNVGISEDAKKHSGVVHLPKLMHDIETFTAERLGGRLTPELAFRAISTDVDRLVDSGEDDCGKDGQCTDELKAIIRSRLGLMPSPDDLT